MRHLREARPARRAALAAMAGAIVLAGSTRAAAQGHTTKTKPGSGSHTSGAVSAASFSSGTLQDSTVGSSSCGTNSAGEPAIHVSRAGNLFLGSELGLGGGSELWRGLGANGGAGASACGLEFRGQPRCRWSTRWINLLGSARPPRALRSTRTLSSRTNADSDRAGDFPQCAQPRASILPRSLSGDESAAQR
jgi:hypothetical protein